MIFFKDVQFEETENGFILPIFDPSITGQELVYGVDLLEDFADDEVFATIDGHTAIHVHGKKNALMVIQPKLYSAVLSKLTPV